MGCWNKTCALSNLHIYCGDPVYVFILERNESVDSHCYSSHLYTPFLFPFNSFYDDYGCGENSFGVTYEFMFEQIKNNFVETKHLSKDKFEECTLFQAMRGNKLFLKTKYGSQKQLDFVLMRKDFVDEILKNFSPKVYGDSKTYRTNYNSVIKGTPKLIETIQKNTKTQKGIINHLLILDSYWLDDLDSEIEPWYKVFTGHYLTGGSRNIKFNNKIIDLILQDKLKEAEEVINTGIKGAFIHSFMDVNRRSWIPQCGEGSQDDQHEYHQLMAKTVIKVLKKEAADRES